MLGARALRKLASMAIKLKFILRWGVQVRSRMMHKNIYQVADKAMYLDKKAFYESTGLTPSLIIIKP